MAGFRVNAELRKISLHLWGTSFSVASRLRRHCRGQVPRPRYALAIGTLLCGWSSWCIFMHQPPLKGRWRERTSVGWGRRKNRHGAARWSTTGPARLPSLRDQDGKVSCDVCRRAPENNRRAPRARVRRGGARASFCVPRPPRAPPPPRPFIHVPAPPLHPRPAPGSVKSRPVPGLGSATPPRRGGRGVGRGVTGAWQGRGLRQGAVQPGCPGPALRRAEHPPARADFCVFSFPLRVCPRRRTRSFFCGLQEGGG